MQGKIYLKKIEQKNISKCPKFFDQDWKHRNKGSFDTIVKAETFCFKVVLRGYLIWEEAFRNQSQTMIN